jgi:exosortase E/protease (VPEID-CTERM system)
MNAQIGDTRSTGGHRVKLAWGLITLGLLFLLEKTCLNFFVDFNLAQEAHGMGAFLRIAQHWGFRFIVAFVAAATLLVVVRREKGSQLAHSELSLGEIRPRWVIAHFTLVGLLAPIGFLLYRYTSTDLSLVLVAALWLTVGIGAVVTALLALAPEATWLIGARSLGSIWVYAGLSAIAGTSAMRLSQNLWWTTARFTFKLVKFILTPMLPSLSANPATLVLSTERFAVQVSDICSGLEGIGLIMAFVAAWLLYFRREYIFPRALLLFPVSVIAMFSLNVLRIAALILIGNAGFSEIAIYGFHSQAGWIAFNLVGCAVMFFSSRSRWLNRNARRVDLSGHTYNPRAVYLVPFLAILAAGILSHAMSGRFETMYALRLIAGTLALFIYRREILNIEWKFSWRGPATGIFVFLLWIGSAQVLLPHLPIPDHLAAFSPEARTGWILTRLLASVVTVPLAEELAYRGFLMRRLEHHNFETVPYGTVSWRALAVTAIVFGIGHGALWLPGVAAGIAYGLLAVRRGQLGEAVVAHATTNALLAVAVLGFDQWELW